MQLSLLIFAATASAGAVPMNWLRAISPFEPGYHFTPIPKANASDIAAQAARLPFEMAEAAAGNASTFAYTNLATDYNYNNFFDLFDYYTVSKIMYPCFI
jgi:hypothetical protein